MRAGSWPSTLLSQAPRFSVRDASLAPNPHRVPPLLLLGPGHIPFPGALGSTHTDCQGAVRLDPVVAVPLLPPTQSGSAAHWALEMGFIPGSQTACMASASWSPSFLTSWVNDTTLQSLKLSRTLWDPPGYKSFLCPLFLVCRKKASAS